jgi:hypothetical protein
MIMLRQVNKNSTDKPPRQPWRIASALPRWADWWQLILVPLRCLQNG